MYNTHHHTGHHYPYKLIVAFLVVVVSMTCWSDVHSLAAQVRDSLVVVVSMPCWNVVHPLAAQVRDLLGDVVVMLRWHLVRVSSSEENNLGNASFDSI